MRKAGVGKSESEVLRFVAERGGATVTEAGDHLAATKGQTRNTALNTMERLRKKGFLVRTKVDGVYRYATTVPKATLLEGLVEDFVQGVLGGSVAPLMAYLGRRADVNEDQHEALRKLVKSLEEEDAS